VLEFAGLVYLEAVPDQQVAMIDAVAAVGAFFVNRSFNLKLPLTR
jgi:hypothetical protein